MASAHARTTRSPRPWSAWLRRNAGGGALTGSRAVADGYPHPWPGGVVRTLPERHFRVGSIAPAWRSCVPLTPAEYRCSLRRHLGTYFAPLVLARCALRNFFFRLLGGIAEWRMWKTTGLSEIPVCKSCCCLGRASINLFAQQSVCRGLENRYGQFAPAASGNRLAMRTDSCPPAFAVFTSVLLLRGRLWPALASPASR